MFHEAFLAGIWGSAGSALGKLAGTESVVVSYLEVFMKLIRVNDTTCYNY